MTGDACLSSRSSPDNRFSLFISLRFSRLFPLSLPLFGLPPPSLNQTGLTLSLSVSFPSRSVLSSPSPPLIVVRDVSFLSGVSRPLVLCLLLSCAGCMPAHASLSVILSSLVVLVSYSRCPRLESSSLGFRRSACACAALLPQSLPSFVCLSILPFLCVCSSSRVLDFLSFSGLLSVHLYQMRESESSFIFQET